LSALTPYVVRDISHVYYRQGKFSLSATWRLRALRLFEETGNTNEVIRTRLNIAWAYARAGDTAKATAFLPSSVPDDMTHLLNGAKAVIAFAQRRWHDAKTYGLLALQGARLAHDFVDAAEVSLIISKALAELGSSSDAKDYIRLAALLANRQDTNADALMVLNLRSEGGEAPNEATVFCGSGGFHPDACFTPGVG
jgi:tetratricopeptide (TPR) repeat protein